MRANGARRAASSTVSRGYGADHQRERQKWAARVDAGQVGCARCGRQIRPGEAWDLGHDDQDRGRYWGPEHSHCNRQAGGRRRHGKLTPPVLPGSYHPEPLPDDLPDPRTVAFGEVVRTGDGSVFVRTGTPDAPWRAQSRLWGRELVVDLSPDPKDGTLPPPDRQ